MDDEYLFPENDAKGGSQRLRILRFNKTAFISNPSLGSMLLVRRLRSRLAPTYGIQKQGWSAFPTVGCRPFVYCLSGERPNLFEARSLKCLWRARRILVQEQGMLSAKDA